MNGSDEYRNCVTQTASLWFASNYSSIRDLLERNGYKITDLILYAIDHAGGLKAQMRFASFSRQNFKMTVSKSTPDGEYDRIIEVEECDFSPSCAEDQVLMEIISDAQTRAQFTDSANAQRG